jgi:hypothetical protein
VLAVLVVLVVLAALAAPSARIPTGVSPCVGRYEERPAGRTVKKHGTTH